MTTYRRRLYDRKKSAPLSVRIAGYLREGPIAARGLSDFSLVRENPWRAVLRAQSPQGPLALKFLDRHHSRRAVSSARIVQHLPSGVGPPLVFADVGEETLRRYGLACLAWQWIEGRPIELDNSRDVADLMKLLAKMNGAGGMAGHQLQAEQDGSLAGIMPANLDALARITRMVVGGIARSAGWADTPKFKAVENRIGESLARFYPACDRYHLVQMDVNPGNFIRGSGGRIYAIDFDHITYGPFQIQIAGLLEYICACRRPGRFDARPLAGRLEAAQWDAPAEPYFSALPASHRARWEATRGDVIPIAFALIGGLHLIREAHHARRNPLRVPTHLRAAAEMLQQLHDWMDA